MPDLSPQLVPPATKGHLSVARLVNDWYIACRSSDLRAKPLARTVLGTPLVLFRATGGGAAALLDRCPHRNVPLSLGRVVSGGQLQCAYHGWQFDRVGQCRFIPGLLGAAGAKERKVTAYPTREQQGFVWVYMNPEAPATREPFVFPSFQDARYARVVQEVRAEATLHATLENALDVPHTAFLHRGLFRGGKRNPISAAVKRSAERVEIEYRGEPRPKGLAGRILSPSGGTVEHWDRFVLPSVAQVEYRLGDENHFVISSACTPVSDFETRLFAVASFRTRFPARVVRHLLKPFALHIFRQDARILKTQTETIRRFGGEQFMSTELDLMGPHIWRLLKQAERGQQAPEESVIEREVQFEA